MGRRLFYNEAVVHMEGGDDDGRDASADEFSLDE